MSTLPLPTILPCLEHGLQVNHHGLIPYFSYELTAMSHIDLPKKEEPGAITRLTRFWTQGHVHKLVFTRSIRCQDHHQCLDYLHVLVLRHRNSKELIEQRNNNQYCFILPCMIPMVLWPHCTLPQNSFLYSFFKGGLWIASAPDSEAWWLKLNTQSAGTQRCPALSCVSVLFLQPDS